MGAKRYGPLEWFCVLDFSGMILLIAAQVIFRYCFNNPLSWTEELARLLFVFGTFAAAVVAVRHQSHISIDVVFEKLPRSVQRALTRVNRLLVLVFMLTVAFTSLPLLKASLRTASAALRFPTALFYVPVTVTSLFISYVVLRQMLAREKESGGSGLL